MKALGSYSTSAVPQVERRPAQLVTYHGPRAAVRLLDGTTYSMPADPLLRLGLAPGERFVIIATLVGKRITDLRVERHEARPPRTQGALPKVYVRNGQGVRTRKNW
jgi:hypothetical protein